MLIYSIPGAKVNPTLRRASASRSAHTTLIMTIWSSRAAGLAGYYLHSGHSFESVSRTAVAHASWEHGGAAMPDVGIVGETLTRAVPT